MKILPDQFRFDYRNRSRGIQMRSLITAFCLILLCSTALFSNPWNGKIVLQGFWWDYWNSNYPNNWATYLADLAPRLREMGVDAVWIPPTVKNNSTSSVGYSPFDHYDLGDKFQKGSVTTRFGNKDEYLRMVAVLHANGIEVIQDVVWNHLANAGSNTGAGGEDPAAWSNQWKNFRYVSYQTPVDDESADDYLARAGRFPKNWQNFHPNPAHNTEADDWTAGYWGPDVCYYSDSYGQSSNATYNPAQSSNYMRNGVRAWNIWMKKQTGVDGYRIDAAKHFPYWATKDFLWNLTYNAGWASGGSTMFAVGEYVGGKAELDAWVDNVNNSDGFTDVVGTFDFSLRTELHNMVYSLGSYNIGVLPNFQQDRRTRTVPFVNNHDTFRPIVDGNGNYDAWDTANELGGGHIDPREARIEAAYAVAMAVDGSPQIFFEDLFDIGTSGNRWSHDPASGTALPSRDYLTNLIWCHQKLNFKDGSYKVRWQAEDLLIIERSGQAIIGISDNWDTWQSATISVDFANGTQLHDYSGANANDILVSGGQATIWTPPCNGSNLRRGYTVWGPAGTSGGFSPAAIPTTQEWEMADDLGDSHAQSLQQGGQLPANSVSLRTAGKIWSAAGQNVNLEFYPGDPGQSYTVELYAHTGTFLQSYTATGNGALSYTPPSENWLVVKLRNTTAATVGQNIWVKAAYHGPQVMNRNDASLPVELQSCTATFLNGKVYLNWSTASEINNAFWEIERRESEGCVEIIGRISGYGNSSARHDYEFADESAQYGHNYYYRLSSIDINGKREAHDWIEVNLQTPLETKLNDNYPNPFGESQSFRGSPATTIPFALSRSGRVTLDIYAADGRHIQTLYSGDLEAGQHHFLWNGQDGHLRMMASGVYFFALQAEGKQFTRKMLLLR
jgi:alpha-amylase